MRYAILADIHSNLEALEAVLGALAKARVDQYVCVGDVVGFHLGYTPFAVNYFDAYHVVERETVIDIWPIMPRGPMHGGLIGVLEGSG